MTQRIGFSPMRACCAFLLAVLLMGLPFFTLRAEETPVISLSSTELVLAKEKSATLKVTLPRNKKATISWETSNRSVARVQGGVVEGRGVGTAVITAKARFADGSEASAQCPVMVFVASQNLTVHGAQQVCVGASIPLKVKIEPANATYKTATWSSSNPEIATVDDDGVVTGLKKGQVTITARSTEPATASTKPRSGSMKITVVQGVEEVQLQESLTIAKGKTAKLTATVLPKNANNKTVKWSTSNAKIATVQGGTVTAKAGGVVTITASVTNPDGTMAAARCAVTVQVAAAKMETAAKQLSLEIGEEAAPLALKFSPADTTDQTVRWIMDDPFVASVDENGFVTGLKGGFTALTAISNSNPKLRLTLPVTVIQRAEGLALTGSDTVSNGRSTAIQPVFTPHNVTNRVLAWSSSDTAVATVDENGIVTGTGRGQCLITAATTDGTHLSAAWSMQVNQQVLSLTPGQTGRQLITQGRSARLSVSPEPADADNPAFAWRSSDAAVATVDPDGAVTAVAPGECAIIAYALDGGGAETAFDVAVEPANPVTITGIEVYYHYEDQDNCLFVTPQNNNRFRTVKSFSFVVQMRQEDGTVLESVRCDWDGDGFKSFGPGQEGKSGSWHWHDIPQITTAPLLSFTVVAVTYSDGTHEDIPAEAWTPTTFH